MHQSVSESDERIGLGREEGKQLAKLVLGWRLLGRGLLDGGLLIALLGGDGNQTKVSTGRNTKEVPVVNALARNLAGQ